MANNSAKEIYIDAEPYGIEAGTLSYGLWVPKYDPTTIIKAGSRYTVASEKGDNNLQSIKFNIENSEIPRLRALVISKGSKGVSITVTNGGESFDYKTMFISDGTDLVVEDNGKPTTPIEFVGTQVV